MKLYTEDQVEKLLKEQRRICEERADWLSHPDHKFFSTGKMLSADLPDLTIDSFDSLATAKYIMNLLREYQHENEYNCVDFDSERRPETIKWLEEKIKI